MSLEKLWRVQVELTIPLSHNFVTYFLLCTLHSTFPPLFLFEKEACGLALDKNALKTHLFCPLAARKQNRKLPSQINLDQNQKESKREREKFKSIAVAEESKEEEEEETKEGRKRGSIHQI